MILSPSSLDVARRLERRLDLRRGLLAVGLSALALIFVGCEAREAPRPDDQPAAPTAPAADAAPLADAADTDPDFQILSTDKKKKTVTFRNKKTGKTETLPLDAFYKRLAEREKAGAAERGDSPAKPQPGVKEAQPEDLPPWVALYAGAEVKTNVKADRDGKVAGRIIMMTSDSADKVAQFYEKRLEDNGFTLMRSNSDATRSISARRKSGEIVSLSINPNSETKKTTVMLTYAMQ
ncbi:MAG: hypothetical protein CFK52_07740 [Chloracidobacterium sp. CP2_5A]|nr:MAG: hypothetical protein CFK52_07740 [Chloracidobacterium sp. CP2_5A]